jgi:hypothetical protein
MTDPFPVLTTLGNIDQSEYLATETYIMGLLMAEYPDRDFGYGTALYTHVVVPASVAMAAMSTNAGIMGQALTLQWLRANAATVDSALASALLSNYYQTLAVGKPSVGTIAVVISTFAPATVAQGTQFTANGYIYVTTEVIYVQLSPGAVTSDNDRLLTARSDGNYQFLVPVQSVVIGTATFAPQGTSFALANPPPSFVAAIAATDISGGSDNQTIAELIAQIPAVLATQTFGSAVSNAALLTKQFPGSQVTSIGFGDPLMTRDTHNLLQVSTGGMVDIYVATQQSVETSVETLSATLINVGTNTWEIVIPQSAAAGIYAITKVVPAGSQKSGMPIVLFDRSISIPPGLQLAVVPLITTPQEAAFSAYQALRIRFTDIYQSSAGLSPGATRNYDLTTLSMPLISGISEFLTAATVTSADNVVIKAAVPCLTQITMVIRLLDNSSLSTADLTNITAAIVSRVAAVGFGYGVLSAAAIAGVVAPFLTGRSDISENSISLRGDILAPSGQTLVIVGQELRIPENPIVGVSARNTLFLTDPSRISIAVQNVSTP